MPLPISQAPPRACPLGERFAPSLESAVEALEVRAQGAVVRPGSSAALGVAAVS